MVRMVRRSDEKAVNQRLWRYPPLLHASEMWRPRWFLSLCFGAVKTISETGKGGNYVYVFQLIHLKASQPLASSPPLQIWLIVFLVVRGKPNRHCWEKVLCRSVSYSKKNPSCSRHRLLRSNSFWHDLIPQPAESQQIPWQCPKIQLLSKAFTALELFLLFCEDFRGFLGCVYMRPLPGNCWYFRMLFGEEFHVQTAPPRHLESAIDVASSQMALWF